MSKKPVKKKDTPKSGKSQKSKVVKQLLIGSMVAGGVELMSESAWAQACIEDSDCGPPPWVCIQDANVCNNFCNY